MFLNKSYDTVPHSLPAAELDDITGNFIYVPFVLHHNLQIMVLQDMQENRKGADAHVWL